MRLHLALLRDSCCQSYYDTNQNLLASAFRNHRRIDLVLYWVVFGISSVEIISCLYYAEYI